MSKLIQESWLGFIDRSLTDTQTGKVTLNKRDQAILRKKFAAIGRDVRRPFKDEDDLLLALLSVLGDANFFLFYEQLRLIVPGYDDPLDNLSAWTKMRRGDYLAIRIVAKLNYLRADGEHLADWICDRLGEGYTNAEGRIAYEDEDRMVELDRLLEKVARATPWPGDPEKS